MGNVGLSPFTAPNDLHLVPLGLTAALGSARIPASKNIYKSFVGDWTIRSVAYPMHGPSKMTAGRWSFRWILGGSAMEDVIGADDRDARGVWRAGVGVRFYDSAAHLWRISYVEPFTNDVILLTARRIGPNIVQTVVGGTVDPQVQETWTFEEIAPDSFRWIDRIRKHGGAWRVEQEIFATRESLP